MVDALLIGASEGLITEAAKGILTYVISRAAEEVKHAWSFKQNLKTLEIKLRRIQLLLTGAETASSNPLVHDWLNDVKTIAYDANDLLDELAFEALKQRLAFRNRSTVKALVRCSMDYSIVFWFRMSRRVRQLMNAISGVFEDARLLGIRPVEIAGSSGVTGAMIEDVHLQVQRELVCGQGLIGRDEDEVHVISMLCDPTNLNRDLSVFGVVGIAGLGKTSLCKKVFNADRVKEHFEQRIWACVSHDFEVKGLLRKMVELAGGQKTSAVSDHQAMLLELQKTLRGKRYLLVLDDVWDTMLYVWETLYGVLLDIGGSKGTVILATSRSSHVVASMNVHQTSTAMKKPFIYELEGLSFSDSWLLFQQRLNNSIGADPVAKDIASKMVIKCKGVPLAIKALGDLLRPKGLEDWKEVEESEIWKLEDKYGLLPSLKLSFNYLPSAAVKNCFAYCAIFPEDAIIYKEGLILLWMAQGFLLPHDRMEQIGNEYFDILLNNSFFQDLLLNEHGDVKVCQMHDLVHALAKAVSKDEYLILRECTDISNISTDIRHLSLQAEKGLPLMLKQKLRTIMSYSLHISKPHDLIRHAKCLRVLILVDAGLTELPESIGHLKHLRYLDISENDIMILPPTISRLYNLQILRHECTRFVHWSTYPAFPKGLGELVNLRHLYSNGTSCTGFTLRILLEDNTSEPEQRERKWGTRISDLSLLNDLRGSLAIRQLENVPSREETRKASLCTKAHIHKLELAWSFNATDLADSETVLEELRPHSNLKFLGIWYYKGKMSPSWLTGLANLQHLEIFYCPNLEKLPTTPAFPFLKELVVWGCDRLTSFPDLSWLESVEKLRICRCPMLAALPSVKPLKNLKVLEIHNCGKLTSLPDGMSDLSGLRSLELGPLCWDLEFFLFPTDLDQSSPLAKSLWKLHLTGWPKVKELPHQLMHLTCLRSLRIGYFDRLEAIPDWLENLISLGELELVHMASLKYLPSQLFRAVRKITLSGRIPLDTSKFPPVVRKLPFFKIERQG